MCDVFGLVQAVYGYCHELCAILAFDREAANSELDLGMMQSEKIDIDRSIFTVASFWMYVHEEDWILDYQKRRYAICYSLCIYLKYIVHALYTCYILHLPELCLCLKLKVE